MKGETKSAGFTIVETLIVLAVTGLLFIMVMVTLNGQQGRAQFQQSVRDLQTKVQQIINEVSSGYFPSNGDFSCLKGADPLNPGYSAPIITATASAQGTNQACMFMGKLIQFSVTNPPTTPEEYDTYTLAGLRDNVSSFDEARVIAVDPLMTKKDILNYGLTVTWVKYIQGGVATDTNSVGFVPEVGDLSTAKSYEAGAVDLIAVPTLTVASTASDTIDVIRQTHLMSALINPDGGVKICLKSGTTKDTAMLNIGSNGHNLAVTLVVGNCVP